MTAIELSRDELLTSLLADAAGAPLAAPGRFGALRAEAAAALEYARLPIIKDEEWRFTPLKSLRAHTFHQAPDAPVSLEASALAPYLAPEAASSRLVFVDGQYAPELSATGALPAGCQLVPLAEADPEFLAGHLGHVATLDNEVFTALNARFARHGAALVVPAGAVVEAPIQLLFVSTGERDGLVTYPRCLVVAGPSADVTVLEAYVCLKEGVGFTNAVTEVVVNANARVRHARVQSESRQGFHVGRTAVSLARDASYCAQSITLGARLSRLDVDVLQLDTGTEAILDGLAYVAGEQEADTHTCIQHLQPHGRSQQLHKCVVDDSAHAVFNGRIVVGKGAQQTDSSQQSRTLLLSPKARIDAKPELEIYADDVKCAHGATVGQINAEELFYLESRGLNEAVARDLLTYAFAAEVLDKVPVPSLKAQLQAVVMHQTDRSRRRS